MKSTRLERISWYAYDWANSGFYTTVITVFLGPYLTTIVKNAADASGYIYFLGIPIFAGTFFPFVVSISVILQVAFLPLIGAIADWTNRKKLLLGIFAYLGSFATIGLYFLEGEKYLLGAALFIIANISFGCSVVVYNAFLNDIAEKEESDKISSIGWAIGYLGGGLLLAGNLMLFSNAESLGISLAYAIRLSLCSAGLWWAIFTIPTMLFLKDRLSARKIPKGQNYFLFGFKQFFHTLKDAKKYPKTLLFLIAYLIYNDGVQAVIVLSSQFGQEELSLDMATLTTVILVVQFVAFFGSLLFSFISNKIGARNAILLSLVVWSAALVYAFGFLESEFQFFLMAIVIAIVLGGTQALSRSLFANLIPKGKEAEYFSMYEISERGTSWLGPFVFGLTLQFTGSYRFAILSLILFFIIGFLLLFKLKAEK
ncbi:MAG: MFS transporter [Ignavibacteria bacterium]|jgi:UMF1 family MFS transporter|nr:MFS transporter [Ignavibacteria bacterium]